MRLFLDANILFSAIKTDGAVRRLLELLHKAGHELAADDYVMEEARRNVESKAPAPGSYWRIELIVSILPAKKGTIPTDVSLAEKDRPVLASAIAHNCDALVTGDKRHFGHLFGEQVAGLAVHSPQSIAEMLIG